VLAVVVPNRVVVVETVQAVVVVIAAGPVEKVVPKDVGEIAATEAKGNSYVTTKKNQIPQNPQGSSAWDGHPRGRAVLR